MDSKETIQPWEIISSEYIFKEPWFTAQQLEETEDLTVHLLSLDEVKHLLTTNQIRQSLMATPLWKYIAENQS